MIDEIPVSETTETEEFLNRVAWDTRPAASNQIAIRPCPHCGNGNWKFYINRVSGLWDCKACTKTGNLFQLKSHVALTATERPVSIKDVAQAKSRSTLPDFDAAHARLLSPDGNDALNYAHLTRGWSMEAIRALKLGYWEKGGKKWLVIPYFDEKGKPCYYKARTIPPEKKSFDSPAGYEAPIFNVGVLKPGMSEVICAEGEPDCIAMLSNGFDNTVGIPGASAKKSTWVDLFDQLESNRIVILFDRDKPGQEGAKALAEKLGLHKCYNAVLPEFTLPDGKPGKDVNDWFVAGRSADELRQIVADARKFDVAGVQNVRDVLAELGADLEERGNPAPKYLTPWKSLTAKVGGFEDGDLVGILACEKVGKTTVALNMLHWYAAVEGRVCFNLCLEMPTKRSVRKWVSHCTQTEDSPGASKMTPQTVRDALEVAAGLPGDLLFGYSKDRDPKTIFDLIRQAVRRYSVSVVTFDHLHILCRSVEHQAQEVARLAADFKALAMELNILLILIIQPNRVADGQIVGANNILGSSMVGKMVDSLICLHRNRVGQIREKDFQGIMETDSALEPQMLCKVELSRYAAGGATTLYMDGATSTVREMNEPETTAWLKPRPTGIPVESTEEVTENI